MDAPHRSRAQRQQKKKKEKKIREGALCDPISESPLINFKNTFAIYSTTWSRNFGYCFATFAMHTCRACHKRTIRYSYGRIYEWAHITHSLPSLRILQSHKHCFVVHCGRYQRCKAAYVRLTYSFVVLIDGSYCRHIL